jgi:hypothetical protein
VEVHPHPAHGLHGVGVHGDVAPARQRRQPADGLEGAGLVVGQHQGGQPGLGAEGFRHPIGIDDPLAIGRDAVDGPPG